MKIYKKLFAYVQDKKYLGVLAIIFSAISAALTVYGYYLIYKFLDKLIINSNLSGAERYSIKICYYTNKWSDILFCLRNVFTYLGI
ncbi:ABC transporter ATP-binding protein/permease [Streptococcus pneumoniae]|nr:ABC transporter ATP-binding protein/permease [Streptococcus pneumoniae]